MITIGNETNFNELIKKDLVLIAFFAPWCGPCRMLEPVLEELAAEQLEIDIVRINVDENLNLAKQYGVMSVPTLLLLKQGSLIATKNGFVPKELLDKWLKENMA